MLSTTRCDNHDATVMAAIVRPRNWPVDDDHLTFIDCRAAVLSSSLYSLSLLNPIYTSFLSTRTMAGTFDPNQAQNLAEVRHSVPRSPRWWLKGFICCWGFRSRNSAYPRPFLIPPLLYWRSFLLKTIWAAFYVTDFCAFYCRFAVKAVEHAQVSA